MKFKSSVGCTLTTGQKAKFLTFLILTLKATFPAVYGKSLRVSTLIDLYFLQVSSPYYSLNNYRTSWNIEYAMFLLPGKSTFSLYSMIPRFVIYICRHEAGI